MTAPSNANTSGLEVVAWRIREQPGKAWTVVYDHEDHRLAIADGFESEPYAVTAASAQARIAELEALVESIRRAQRDVIRAEIEQEGYEPISDANDRATAAEARADRLAKALEAVISYAPDIRPARIARAALQQETQP